MNARPDLARELRLALSDPRALCSVLGLGVDARDRQMQGRGGVTVRCPRHGGVALSVTLGPDGTVRVRCFGCGFAGDALHLVAEVRGLNVETDFPAVLREAASLAGSAVVVESLERPTRREPEPEGATDETYNRIWSHVLDLCSPLRTVAPRVAGYLRWRGLETDAEAAGIRGLPHDERELVTSMLAMFERRDLEAAGVLRTGRDALAWHAWSLLVPWRDRYGRIQCVQRRRIDDGQPKYRSPRGRAPRAPFGVESLSSSLAERGRDAGIVLVEGALDACARRAVARFRGERAVVLGVYSASAPEVGLPLDVLKGRRVVLALDVDQAGERACRRLAEVLGPVAGEIQRERVGGGAKDWAAALVAATGARR